MSARQMARQRTVSSTRPGRQDTLQIDRVELCPECRWKFLNKQHIEVRRKRMAGSARMSAMTILSCIHQGNYGGARNLHNDIPLAGAEN